MKIVLNRGHLAPELFRKFKERTGLSEEEFKKKYDGGVGARSIPYDDPTLIAVIEDSPEANNGALRIREIPDNVHYVVGNFKYKEDVYYSNSPISIAKTGKVVSHSPKESEEQ